MTALTQTPDILLPSGWSASLDLQFERRGGRTVLVRNRHEGPLRVQRPFYPETAGQAHVYILHPPGGIVAGDSLTITARVDSGAHALLTTPSAGRVYKSNLARLPQSQSVVMQVSAGGFGEWLPQENILFDNAQADNSTRINLHGDAGFIGWEITCLGRPASADWFTQGSLQQTFSISRDGRPLLLERSRFEGGSPLLQAAWGLQGFTTTGTLVCVARDKSLLQGLKQLCEQANGAVDTQQRMRVAATALPHLIVVRGLADNAAPLRRFFIACWQQMRRQLLQREPVAPRIWFT